MVPTSPLLLLVADAMGELFAHVPLPLALKLTCTAARAGHPEPTKAYVSELVAEWPLLRLAFTFGLKCDHPWVYNQLGKRGDLHVLTQALAGGVPWDDRCHCRNALEAAAANGHLNVLKWAFGNPQGPNARSAGMPWDARMCAAAAGGGHLEVLQWARTVNGFWCDRSACYAAAEGGHLACLEWFASNNWPWSPHAHYLAASNGHLDVLKWLDAQGYRIGQPQTDPICDCHDPTLTKDAPATVAAANGNLLMLEWMRSAAYDFHCAIMAAAVRGHLDAVKWLRGIGCRWDAMACRGAAYGGHLEVLQWLRANGCDWDASECKKEAEREGHSRTLAWIVANSGPESPLLVADQPPQVVEPPQVAEPLQEQDEQVAADGRRSLSFGGDSDFYDD